MFTNKFVRGIRALIAIVIMKLAFELEIKKKNGATLCGKE